ncbi:hypothetical protein [Tardiphaga sp. OK245]|uniref:hypothetical protein n=1 Tax=Tardiphaga sp. OK245 TaxID=1855306 RepID=UPI0008A7C65C|nr:hypothetical protein [Tardiphaga sp. OK245]SEI09169.1 hypothetical protein SAMN05216367_3695 [Tardiphaga sp. OK245]
MLRLLTLTVVAMALIAGAQAADMAGQGRIGRLFDEPVVKSRRVVVVKDEKPIEEPIVQYAPEVDISSIVHGYYGKPNSYYYRNYYGTPSETIFSRAPYGCGYYGYC